MNAIALAARQGTDAWLEMRRTGVTSTDIPAILGIDAYGRAEADVALDKDGLRADETDAAKLRAMRLGKAMEDLVRGEDELEHHWRLRRVNRLLRHPEIEWALTDLDFEVVGDRVIVEAKTSRARRWEAGELPQDVEAQVRWQMGVAGYPRAHVAALLHGSELACFDLEHDEGTFAGLVAIAADFWRRYRAGEPLVQSAGSVKRRYPADNGSEVYADQDVTEAVLRLLGLRDERKVLEAAEELLETAVKARMGDAATLIGTGFRVTWKRTKDREETDWRSLAAGLLSQLPEPERSALVGLHSTVRAGFRPFRVVKEDVA